MVQHPFKRMAGLLLLPLLVSAAGEAQNTVSYASAKTVSRPHSYASYSTTAQEKQTLFSVLKDLNKAKGVYFLFSEENMGATLVKVAKDYGAETEKILAEILKDTGLKYKKVSGNTFVIVYEKEKPKLSTDILNIVGGEITSELSIKNSRLPVTGRVTTSDGQPLPGVSVRVKGTSRGTTTNAQGEFSIEAAKGETLVISYVGYQTSEAVVGDNNSVRISLTASDAQLSEVVVTALGVTRQRKVLGYSVTEVKGEELTKARETNVMNSLVGKVAGLNVSSVNGGAGSASNVIIRGVSSLGTTTPPLYVINGVPIESQPQSQGGGQYDNGPDRGDAIGNINPDDIETISVLKGAAASALYGYRAKAGVILITTKSGKGNGIEFNSNFVTEKIIDLTDWQYVYGQGANNVKPATQMAAFQAGQSSYGGRLDGSQVVQFDGVLRPYTAQQNNLKNFYQTGNTFTNTLAFNKSFTGGAVRFSASNLTNKAVIPYSGLNRQSFNLAANFNAVKNLTIDARANYVLEQARNRPFLSDGPGNANFNVMFLPTSVDVDVLKKTVNADGSEYGYSANTYATNPWFAAEKFITNTARDRLISSVTARYNFDNGFFVQGRVGRDAYTDRYKQVVPTGTAYRPNGSISEQSAKFTDLNVDGLAGKTFLINNGDFTITPNVGGSYRRIKYESINNDGSEFAVPFVYNIGNAKFKGSSYAVSDQQINSAYGTLEIAVKNYLFVTGSVRSDWFSTLATPGRDNKLNIVYPSVSASFVFSEFFKPSWLSFGKLRSGYAVVGQATTPYQTQLSYGLFSPTLNGLPLGNIANGSVPNPALQPSDAIELEIGTEMRLFNNRLNLDVTWYNKKSRNEIVSAPASTTSGYSGAVLNIGELRNKGWEVLVSGYPFRGKSFSWMSSLNGSANDNKVLKLAAGQAQLGFATSRTGVAYTQDLVGLPSVQVMAYDYRYDAQGKIALTTNGLPDRGKLVPLGSAYHKWVGGWNNEFNYKRFSLSFLIDGKWGGKIFSATDWYGYLFGLHKATLENREGKFGNGSVDAATYYSTVGNNVSKIFVYDASFVKFRQLTIGYNLPASLFGNKIQGISISLVARNLFFLMRQTDNIDPEGNYSPFAQGLELGGVPPVRTLGVNLNVKL